MTTSHILGPSEGNHFHFLNHLATVKVAAGAAGALSAVEFLAPRGLGPPLHTHRDEDEMFMVLEGEVAFHSGGNVREAGPGSYAFLPHGEPHTFQVVSDEARFVAITASLEGPPRFDQMVAALGTATNGASLPSPTYIDPTHVADVCRTYDIDVVGPPPPALTVTSPATERGNE